MFQNGRNKSKQKKKHSRFHVFLFVARHFDFLLSVSG